MNIKSEIKNRTDVIYFDNAATSWPKPPEVAIQMKRFIDEIGANPGRSGHRLSIEAARIVYSARETTARIFNVDDPLRVIFGHNITDGINLALHGLLRSGDHVVTTSMEHNAVMRPLNALSLQGVSYTQVPCEMDGSLSAKKIENALQKNTRIIAVNHASNVCGTILPIDEIGAIARAHDLVYLVDTAQSAGAVEIDMQACRIDLLAFTGHKSLYGPMGTGGLVIGNRVDVSALNPQRQGGTGSRSEKEIQPDFYPDRYESGTPNAVGLAGLLAALEWIETYGIETVQSHEQALCAQLISGLAEIPGVTIYGTKDASRQTATVSWNLADVAPSTIGFRLDEEYGILCRVGLHCAPSAHRTMGTLPVGTVRFGLGAFNTRAEVSTALEAITQIALENQ